MKVLQINAVYKKSSTGRNVFETHTYLTEHNIESYIASPDIDIASNIGYKIGSGLDMKVHGLLSRMFGLQGYYSKRATKGLLQYIKKINPDVIHLHNLHGNYINLRLLLKFIAKVEIPLILTLHDCWFYTGKCCYYIEDNCKKWQNVCSVCPAKKKYNKSWIFDFSKKMQKDKEKWFSQIENLSVVGVSSWVTEDSKKSTVLKNAKLYKTIYNWIDLECFSPNNRTKTDDGKFTILGIAQHWSEMKGVGIFLKLSELIDDNTEIVMIGNTNGYQGNDKIKFVGATDSIEELAKYYANADVFVNPSIQETFGKTTAEAMASGTPVVAYNATATPELLGEDGKCGYLLDENEATLYLDKINKIKENGRDCYSANCRARAEKMFDKDTNIAEYLKLYETAIS